MAIFVNDGGTLRTIRFIAVNDNGTIRRVNEVYVNDGGSLEGPFSAVHATTRSTNTQTTFVSGSQETSFATTCTFETNRATDSTFLTVRTTTTTFDTSRDTTTTFTTTRATTSTTCRRVRSRESVIHVHFTCSCTRYMY